MRHLPRRSAAAALAGGAALALPQAVDVWVHPLAGGLLGLAGAGLLYAAVRVSATAGEAARAGWAGGFLHFCVLLHWLVHPFLVSADSHLWALPFAALLLPSGLALYWAGAFWAARRWWPSAGWSPLWFAACLGGAEWLRGSLLTEFPWGLAGYLWIDTPLRNLLSATGIHGLTLLTLLVAAVPASLVAGSRKRAAARAALAVAVPAAAVGIGWNAGDRLAAPAPAVDGSAPILRLVQPNIPQQEKWAREFRSRNIARLLEHSGSGDAAELDLVIWPESALPSVFGRDDPEDLGELGRSLAIGVPLAAGLLTSGEAGTFNSLVAFDGAGSPVALYDKRQLVPFGEYLPFRGLLEFLGFEALARDGIQPGDGPATMALEGLPLLASFICYETVSPSRVRAAAADADWMLQVTNDAWFGPGAGPRQHFAKARGRAAELGLPLVRVANTGISAVIDARGAVLSHLPLGTEGALTAPLPPVLASPTPYARFGDLGFLLLVALGLVGPLASRHRIDRANGAS